jgi:hypothetical protein
MNMIPAIASLLLLSLAGCTGGAGDVAIGEPFSLRPGESTTIDYLKLTFEGVEEDSRCPEGVNCAWEGNARVRLGYMTPDHPPISLHLNTSGRFIRDTTVQRYKIALVDVTPRPVEGKPIDSASYTVKVVVSRP